MSTIIQIIKNFRHGIKAGMYVNKRVPQLKLKGYSDEQISEMVKFELGFKFGTSETIKSLSQGACFSMGAESGATLGTMINPGVGTFIGAGIGGLGGMYTCGKASDFTMEKTAQFWSETSWKPENPVVRVGTDLSKREMYIQNPPPKLIIKSAPQPINTPQSFSKLEPAKLDELKNPPVQGISGSIADATNIGMNVIQPQPVILSQNTTSWLGQLGQVLSGLGSLVQLGVGVAGGIGNIGSSSNAVKINASNTDPSTIQWPSGMKPFHTGGKISGRDEVLAILRGGETVRTEAQEQELQQEQYGRLMEAMRPYLEERENKPKTIAEAYDPNNKIPCLLNKTTQDEELIISIIAQAWKSNRLGFRNVLRYE